MIILTLLFTKPSIALTNLSKSFELEGNCSNLSPRSLNGYQECEASNEQRILYGSIFLSDSEWLTWFKFESWVRKPPMIYFFILSGILLPQNIWRGAVVLTKVPLMSKTEQIYRMATFSCSKWQVFRSRPIWMETAIILWTLLHYS